MSVIIDALKRLQKSKISSGRGLPIRPYPEKRRDFWELIHAQSYLILGCALVVAIVIAAFISPLKNLWVKKGSNVYSEKKSKMNIPSPTETRPLPPLADKKTSVSKEAPVQPASIPPVCLSPIKEEKPTPAKPSKPAIAGLKKQPVPSTREPVKAETPITPSPPLQPERKTLEGQLVVKAYKNLPDYFGQAIVFQNQKDFPKAIEAYEKVLKIDPNYAEAYNNLGIIYNQTGNFEKAVFHLQKAIAADPKYFKAYNNLGVILYQNGHLEAAADQFWKAIRIHPKNMESYVNLALVSRKQKNLDLAFQILQKAYSIDPKSPEVSYHLGLVTEERGENQEAIDHYQRFLRLSSQRENSLAQKVREHVEKLQYQSEARQK